MSPEREITDDILPRSDEGTRLETREIKTDQSKEVMLGGRGVSLMPANERNLPGLHIRMQSIRTQSNPDGPPFLAIELYPLKSWEVSRLIDGQFMMPGEGQYFSLPKIVQRLQKDEATGYELTLAWISSEKDAIREELLVASVVSVDLDQHRARIAPAPGFLFVELDKYNLPLRPDTGEPLTDLEVLE